MNFLKRTEPVLKLITLCIITFELAFFKNFILNFAVFVVCILYVCLSCKKSKQCFLLCLPVLLTAVGMFFVGYRFPSSPSMPVHDSAFLLSQSALKNGLILSSRVTAFSGLLFLFSFTTDRVRLVRSLNQLYRVPSLFSYGLLASFGIFPYISREYRRIRISLRSRDVRSFPVSVKTLQPLLIKSVRMSQLLSLAMESKGFDASGKRSCFEKEKFSYRDFLLLSVTLFLPVLNSVID